MLTPLNRISAQGSAGKHAFGFVSKYDAGLALGGVFHRLRYSFCNLVEQGFILRLYHHADQ